MVRVLTDTGCEDRVNETLDAYTEGVDYKMDGSNSVWIA